MKRFLLALSFALLVPACVGEVADPAAPPEATAADPLQSSGPVAASHAATPAPATSCLSNCQTRYDACLGTADGDPVSECLCYNHLQQCIISCGGHGFLRPC
jgi:hypothetical protein